RAAAARNSADLYRRSASGPTSRRTATKPQASTKRFAGVLQETNRRETPRTAERKAELPRARVHKRLSPANPILVDRLRFTPPWQPVSTTPAWRRLEAHTSTRKPPQHRHQRPARSSSLG